MKLEMILAAAACTAGPVAGSFSKTQLEIAVFDGVIAEQPSSLAQEALGAGRSSRSSRDIDLAGAEHSRIFPMERRLQKMKPCNLHFHEQAEHKKDDFTTHAGKGDDHGIGPGVRFDEDLAKTKRQPNAREANASTYWEPVSGDAIEIHSVHNTAQPLPGSRLGACRPETILNPELRVEPIVAVCPNDAEEAFFAKGRGFDGYALGTGLEPEKLGRFMKSAPRCRSSVYLHGYARSARHRRAPRPERVARE